MAVRRSSRLAKKREQKCTSEGVTSDVVLPKSRGTGIRDRHIETALCGEGIATSSVKTNKDRTQRQHRYQDHIPDYGGKGFVVKSISERRTRNGRELFLANRGNTKVPRRFVRHVQGIAVVRCEGYDFQAESCNALVDESGKEQDEYLIEWKPTWHTANELPQAVVDAFFSRSAAKSERASAVMSISHGPTDSMAACSNQKTPNCVPETHVPPPIFTPKAGRAYTSSVRRMLWAEGTRAIRTLLGRPVLRQLVFRNRFVEADRIFDSRKERHRLGAAMYLVGIQRRRLCDYCDKGNGAFPLCVVASGAKSGACANSIFSDVTPKICNHHISTLESGGCWGAVEETRPSSTESEDENIASSVDWVTAFRAGAMRAKGRQRSISSGPSLHAASMARSSPEWTEETEGSSVAGHAATAMCPDFLRPNFRHTGCPPAPAPCISPSASYRILQPDERAVQPSRVFGAGEASDTEVKWLISRSSCHRAEFLRQIWKYRLERLNEVPLPSGRTKESYLSRWYPGKLNEAAAEVGVE